MRLIGGLEGKLYGIADRYPADYHHNVTIADEDPRTYWGTFDRGR